MFAFTFLFAAALVPFTFASPAPFRGKEAFTPATTPTPVSKAPKATKTPKAPKPAAPQPSGATCAVWTCPSMEDAQTALDPSGYTVTAVSAPDFSGGPKHFLCHISTCAASGYTADNCPSGDSITFPWTYGTIGGLFYTGSYPSSAAPVEKVTCQSYTQKRTYIEDNKVERKSYDPSRWGRRTMNKRRLAADE